MRYYVYELWDIKKNEPFYVGKGCGKRAHVHMSNSHLGSTNGNMLKKNVIKKMLLEDNSPMIKYVFETDNEISAYDTETKLIRKYGRRDIGTGILTNLTDGGVGSTSPNTESRYKMGSAKRGKSDSAETRRKRSESLMGHTVTIEARKKMSIAKKGKIPPCVSSRRSYVGEGNPQFGKVWTQEKRNKMSNTIKGRKRSYRSDGSWFFTYPENT